MMALPAPAVAQMGAPRSEPVETKQPEAPQAVGAPAFGGEAVTLKEALGGLATNSPAFMERYSQPRPVKLKVYFAQLLERKGTTSAVFFQDSPGWMPNNDVQCHVSMDDPLFADAKGLERSTPIIVEGNFIAGGFPGTTTRVTWTGRVTKDTWSTGLADYIISDTCRITGTWDPNARALTTSPSEPAESMMKLMAEARGNSLGFHKTYGQKRVAMSAPLSKVIVTQRGKIILSFNDPSVSGFAGSMSCAIPSSQEDRAASLSVGQDVTVSGVVTKNDDPFLPVPFDLEECQID